MFSGVIEELGEVLSISRQAAMRDLQEATILAQKGRLKKDVISFFF